MRTVNPPTKERDSPWSFDYLLRRWLIEIQHPVDPELVSEHGETRSPGCLLRSHFDISFLTETGEKLVYLLSIFTLDGNEEVVALVEGHAHHIVRGHQNRCALGNSGMGNPVIRFRRNIAAHVAERYQV